MSKRTHLAIFLGIHFIELIFWAGYGAINSSHSFFYLLYFIPMFVFAAIVKFHITFVTALFIWPITILTILVNKAFLQHQNGKTIFLFYFFNNIVWSSPVFIYFFDTVFF